MDLEPGPRASAARLRGRHVELDEQTQAALRTRMVIGQAVGILMARDGLDSDAAFARLVATSQHTNTKLRDVAGRIVVAVDAANRRG